jgi:hypothetical protein
VRSTATLARRPSAVCAGIANICPIKSFILPKGRSCSRTSLLCSLLSDILQTSFHRSSVIAQIW